jgi:NADH:ubiquinone oxidoreductase subunit 6 (subunit J)
VAPTVVQIVLIAATLVFALMAAGMKDILFTAGSLGVMAVCLGGLYWILFAPYVGLFRMLIYGGAMCVLFVSGITFVRTDVS